MWGETGSGHHTVPPALDTAADLDRVGGWLPPSHFCFHAQRLLGRGTGFLTKAGGKERGVARLPLILRPSRVRVFRAQFRLPSTVGCREAERQLPGPRKGGSCISTAYSLQLPGMGLMVGSHPHPSLKILSSQLPLLQESDDCQCKQSFPGVCSLSFPLGNTTL